MSAAAAPVGTRAPGRIFAFIGGRNIARNVRAPMLLAVALLQPLAWLALFSQTFRGLAADPAFRAQGYHDYLTFFTPSMLVLSMLFTALQSGMATMTDIDTGMMDKLLTSPVPRAAILAGRVSAADLWTMLAQGIVIELAAAAMGARFATGTGGALVLLAYGTAFGVIWASVPNLIALRTRSAELTMALGFFLTLPVLFMSSAFFPLRLQPGWLQAVATVNPAAYVITTGQALLNSGYEPGQQARTIIALAVAAAVLIPATVASFRSIKELSGMSVIEVRGLDQALRPGPRGRRSQLQRRRGHRDRLPRPERRGQNHHAAHAARPGHAHRGHRHHQRPPLPRRQEQRRRVAGGNRLPSRPHRPRPSAGAGAGPGRRRGPCRRTAGQSGPRRQRPAAGSEPTRSACGSGSALPQR